LIKEFVSSFGRVEDANSLITGVDGWGCEERVAGEGGGGVA